jgi:CubicO group peptidase (beta-lactamase class C family)
LDISQAGQSWRARIAQYDVPCANQNGRIQFDLPSGQGAFSGRLEDTGSVIRGFWIQPPTVNDGSKFATPVVLRSLGQGHWRGEVVPLPDEFTLYLVVSRKPDGSLGAFLRNPDRNIGAFWRVDRLELDGPRVRLVGKKDGSQSAQVYGEGLYDADENRISIYFPGRGGTYDFAPISDDSGFYARGKIPAPCSYRPPSPGEDGWKVGTLAEVGMVSEPIAELVRWIVSAPDTSVHDLRVHGFLVARHGKLVAEEYFHGFHALKSHDTRSASKSVTATLIGAAIQSGASLGVSTKVYDLLYHGKLPGDLDPRKKEMTVEHLLTMSSGYDCDDSDGTRPGSENTLLDEQKDPDYYRYILEVPLEPKLRPGQEAVYCSINPNLLGAVLAAATKKPLLELFSDLLAEPLQLKDYHLNLQPTGEPYMGGGIKWLPRDFMKFGQLMLDGGVWNGKRILSKEYVAKASSPLVTLRGPAHSKYGYLWWVADYPYRGRSVRGYSARGNGGQLVLVFPELDMVVAFFAGNYADVISRAVNDELVPKYILPALKNESR